MGSGLPPSTTETIYDDVNDRLIVISYAQNSPIVEVDLSDNSVSTITPTNIGGYAGICRDGDYNYYITSVITDCVYRWDSTFANPPELMGSGYNYPSGICWNHRDNIIALSSTDDQTIEYIPLGPSSIGSDPAPSKINLLSNYPNPFNNSTRIEFSLNEPAFVTLTVYDMLGRKVETLLAQEQSAGNHYVLFNDDQLTSGMYFYKLDTGSSTESNTMFLLK